MRQLPKLIIGKINEGHTSPHADACPRL